MTSVDYQPVLHRFPQSAPVTMRRPAGDADQKTGAPETVKRGSAQADLAADLRKAVNPILDYPICPPLSFRFNYNRHMYLIRTYEGKKISSSSRNTPQSTSICNMELHLSSKK